MNRAPLVRALLASRGTGVARRANAPSDAVRPFGDRRDRDDAAGTGVWAEAMRRAFNVDGLSCRAVVSGRRLMLECAEFCQHTLNPS